MKIHLSVSDISFCFTSFAAFVVHVVKRLVVGEIESDKAHPAGWFGMFNAHYPNRVNNLSYPLSATNAINIFERSRKYIRLLGKCSSYSNGGMVIHAVLKHHKSKLHNSQESKRTYHLLVKNSYQEAHADPRVSVELISPREIQPSSIYLLKSVTKPTQDSECMQKRTEVQGLSIVVIYIVYSESHA